MVIASFFYIGALNEAAGHGNRVARFIDKADTLAKKIGSEDARVLKRGSTAASRRSSRRSSGPTDSRPAVVAELSHVTVKNPANITLIQDLNMQARNLFRRLSKRRIFTRPD